MKLTKLLGLLLFILGLAIILYAIFYSYQIFTAKVQPPVIFEAVQSQKAGSVKSGTSDLIGSLTGIDVEKILGGEIQKILPVDYLPKIMNLVSWSVLAGILIFAGSQIASLGIKLLKD